MSEKVILTKEGYEALVKKLDDLKLVKRPEITERIKIAREFGDLSENAEYDAAKNEQARIEGEIVEIEAQLKNVEIIESNSSGDAVTTGCKVTVLFPDLKRTDKYVIVGVSESGSHDGEYYRISNESPIGNALLRHKVGETVEITSPAGKKKAKIVSID